MAPIVGEVAFFLGILQVDRTQNLSNAALVNEQSSRF